VSRIRLLRTASFRLAVLYLALFTASALALGAFVYMSVQREILTDFDERIAEETDALKSDFATGGRERLAGIIEARGSGGAGFSYGLVGPNGKPIAGDLRVSAGARTPMAGRRRRKPAAKSRPNPSRRSYARSSHRLSTARSSSSATSGAARIRS
jgi:hypothetical protein